MLVHLDVYNISSFGHYIAFVVNGDGQWFLCDDGEISPVPKETVLQQNAYMLFYQRRGKPRLFTTAPEGEAATVDLCAPCPAEAGEEEIPASEDAVEAALCTNGCGFFGQAARRGMCTQCYRAEYPEEAEALEACERTESKARAQEKKRQEIAQQVEKLKKDAAKKEAAAIKQPVAKAVAKAAPSVKAVKVKPNDPCPCGSGKKFKKCHMNA